MCCEDRQYNRPTHHEMPFAGHSGMCCCGNREFMDKKERTEMLEEYREELKSELDVVEEELKELRGE